MEEEKNKLQEDLKAAHDVDIKKDANMKVTTYNFAKMKGELEEKLNNKGQTPTQELQHR